MMTAKTLIEMLNRNGVYGYMLVNRADGSIDTITHLEESPFDGTKLRFWTFKNGNLRKTTSFPAPNGDMDLLAAFGEDAETYDEEDGLPTYHCVWFD